MTDEDWVARLLRDAGSPAMPADVAARLDRTVRQEVETHQPADTQADTQAGGQQGRTSSGPAVPPSAGLVPPPATPRLRRVGGTGGTDEPPASDGEGTARGRAVGTSAGPAAPRATGATRRELRQEDAAERRRRLLTRLAPVAAGLLVLGGAGAVALTTLGGSDTAETATFEAAGGAEDSSVPRALVATGTEYTTTDDEVFAQQVRELVAVAASGEDAAGAGAEAVPEAADEAVPEAADEAARTGPEADAGVTAAEDPAAAALAEPPADPAAARSAVDSPLTDRQAFDACVDEVTDGGTTPVTAVDLAVVDGLESTVIVVPDPSGENLLVYVVGPDCTEVDGPGFKFRQVTP